MTDAISPDVLQLAEDFRVLEASLLYWRFLDLGLWPAYEWEDGQVKMFCRLLHRQVHICIARQLGRRPPLFVTYASDPSLWVSRRELIRMTAGLLRYFSTAPVKYNETLLVTLLEQLHRSLIGVHYFQRR
jgi:hypothetical protein